MSGRIGIVWALAAIACASAREREAEESVEVVAAELIERTKDLHSFRAVYEKEGEPTSTIEIVYESPSRVRITTSGKNEATSLQLVDECVHLRSPEEFADLDPRS
jgi:hypothetical protein